MSIVITLCVACLSALVDPVRLHYVYAENPGSSFVSLNDGGHNYAVGVQRRYMGNSNPQVYQNERTAISKTPNIESTATDNKNYRSPTNQKVTEPPRRQEDYMRESRNLKVARAKIPPQNYRPVTNPKNNEYKAQTKQDAYGNMYDSKGNMMQVNVHKTQIAAEPMKVKLNNNRQLTALSVQRRDDNYKRMPTSMLVDKKLQKGSNFKERNAQIMSRVLDDMTKKVTDRRRKNNDYSKRDTVNAYLKSNIKRNIVSENMKKFIGKDMNMMNLSPQKETTGIRVKEEEAEESNAPYALFYRMNPENLDNQEGFYLLKSMEDDGSKVFSIKKKRLSVNYENEVDLKKPKTKKNFNTVKLRKKVKNFSNRDYRTNRI